MFILKSGHVYTEEYIVNTETLILRHSFLNPKGSVHVTDGNGGVPGVGGPSASSLNPNCASSKGKREYSHPVPLNGSEHDL